MTQEGAAQVRVEPVRSRADLRAFLDLPLRLHPRTHAVPLFQDTVKRWWRGVGPHTPHGPVELVLARDTSGRVVGRSTVHSDERMDRKLGEPVQLLGATEFTGAHVLRALTAHASRRAREQGRGTLLGPVSLLPNQTGGVITSGHGERGFVDSPWNPPSYPAAWEAAGFDRVWPAATWIVEDLRGLDADAVFPRGAGERDGIEVHRGHRRRFGEQLPILRGMLNASFAELPYYTPITAAELAAATDGLAWLLDESLLLWASERGEPVAFVLVVPDVSGFVMSTGGRMALLDQVRLLATRRALPREAVLIIKGTVPQARGRGLMTLLSHRLLANLVAGGYETLRVTFVGEENAASAAQFAAMGGRPLHDVCFYRRPAG
ncbi:hypothetical protein [Georgenia faecalis]|uniref:GNAT family N-acetyltransferase n=1 Tax=Georgenia faecalis TaxID=2483799 RepID=A0ABV9D8F3_9MICO|nr:hypothetical protein [Georgenia faecalis]